MSQFDEALTEEGDLLGAWDYDDNARSRMRLFRVGDTATFLAETTVSGTDHESFVDKLVAKGIRIGGAYAGTGYCWAMDEAGLDVWDEDAGGATHRSSPPARCTNVELFIETMGHRGVRFTLEQGTDVIVEQHDSTPDHDPAYGTDDLFMDAHWAYWLGSQVAVWASVPFRDGRDGEVQTNQLPIARAGRALADQLRSGTGALLVPIGAIGRASEVSFLIPVSRRSLDLRVTLSNGEAATSTLKQGTPVQMAAFLRRVSTPSTVLFAMNASIESNSR